MIRSSCPRGKTKGPVIPFLKDKRELAEQDAAWARKIELAQSYAASGYDEAALQIVEACLNREPPTEVRRQLQAMLQTLRIERTEHEIVRVEARPRKDYVVFGDPISLDVRVRNVSDRPLTIHPPKTKGKSPDDKRRPGATVSVDVERTDRDIFASQMQRSWTQNFEWHRKGAKVLRLRPGQVHDFPIHLPPHEVGPAIQGLRVVRVGGTIRPARIETGGQIRHMPLRVRPGRVVVPASGLRAPCARSTGRTSPCRRQCCGHASPDRCRVRAQAGARAGR